MHKRAADLLFLIEQTGSDLHLTTDSKTIYSLIAGRCRRAGSHSLPVIVLRPVVDQSSSLIVFNSYQIETAVAIEVRYRCSGDVHSVESAISTAWLAKEREGSTLIRP